MLIRELHAEQYEKFDGLALAHQSAAETGAAGRRYVTHRLTQEDVLGRCADTLEALAAARIAGVPVWDPLQLC